MTNEEIIQIAIKYLLPYDESGELQWWGKEDQLLKFALAIIEEHEKDREHNLGKDEYFNSLRN